MLSYLWIECNKLYPHVAEVACKYCCFTLHFACISGPFDPSKPYICPRHIPRPKPAGDQISAQQHSRPTISSSLSPQQQSRMPPPPVMTMSQRLAQITSPSLGPSAGARPASVLPHSAMVPQPFPQRANKVPVQAGVVVGTEHAETKEREKPAVAGPRTPQIQAMPAGVTSEQKELYLELHTNLTRAIEQQLKKGANFSDDGYSDDETMAWDQFVGNELYTLSQHNMKSRVKRFGKRFHEEDKVRGPEITPGRRRTRGSVRTCRHSGSRCAVSQICLASPCAQRRANGRRWSGARLSLSINCDEQNLREYMQYLGTIEEDASFNPPPIQSAAGPEATIATTVTATITK